MKHFLDIHLLTAGELEDLIKLAYQLKQGQGNRTCLQNKTVALVFEKPSTRTRVSFEVGVHQLGGHVITLKQDEVGLGKRESVADFARVLSRYVDMIMLRTFSHDALCELAQYASVPVINGLTDMSHPCQIVADFLTIYEQFGSFDDVKICYLGDGNNVTRSLVEAAHLLGVECTVCTPLDHGIKASVPFKQGSDPLKAVSGATVVYTDTWVSMGDNNKSLTAFEPYQVNSSLLQHAAENVIFLHCLPAHRGQEVTDDVMDGSASKVFDQAENRLYAQQAVMQSLMC